MHKIKSIRIEGFLGQKKPIFFELSSEATFIIGRNGTGKTTLINLINSCLSADTENLLLTKFSKIHFTFKRQGKRAVPHLVVQKTVDEEGIPEIIYLFKKSSTSGTDKLVLSTSRGRRKIALGEQWNILSSRSSAFDIRRRLDALFNRTWLSLQRGDEMFDHDEFEHSDISYTTGVDQKLAEVSNSLTKYFSRLDREVANLTQSFQRKWFLSFLATNNTSATSVLRTTVNIDEEEKAIREIFQKFNVPEESYNRQLERHKGLAKKAQNNLRNDANVKFQDFLVVYDVVRLHSLVEQWQELQENQTEIYKPKNNLVEISSDMLFRKEFFVDSSNSVRVNSDHGDKINLEKLSSGEKQLIIFLSETLLQNQTPYIFLADEPELSLHIEWQEQLVPSLFRINPSAQVIFVTHSPDIVGKYQDNLIRMEDLVE